MNEPAPKVPRAQRMTDDEREKLRKDLRDRQKLSRKITLMKLSKRKEARILALEKQL